MFNKRRKMRFVGEAVNKRCADEHSSAQEKSFVLAAFRGDPHNRIARVKSIAKGSNMEAQIFQGVAGYTAEWFTPARHIEAGLFPLQYRISPVAYGAVLAENHIVKFCRVSCGKDPVLIRFEKLVYEDSFLSPRDARTMDKFGVSFDPHSYGESITFERASLFCAYCDHTVLLGKRCYFVIKIARYLVPLEVGFEERRSLGIYDPSQNLISSYDNRRRDIAHYQYLE